MFYMCATSSKSNVYFTFSKNPIWVSHILCGQLHMLFKYYRTDSTQYKVHDTHTSCQLNRNQPLTKIFPCQKNKKNFHAQNS